MPKPYSSTKDIFCLRTTRMVDGYRKISLFSESIEVPGVPLRDYVDVHMIPDDSRNVVDIRIWYHDKLVKRANISRPKKWVHF